jgi:DNA-binding MarR family transcriptional regulator
LTVVVRDGIEMNRTDRIATDAAALDDQLPLGASPPDRLLRLVHWTSNASRQLRRRITDIAAELELSDTELIVVWMCSGEGRVQVDLAGSTGISPAQMSGLMERLRSRGLVAMHRQAGDRRRQIWRATPAGQAVLVTAALHLGELAACLSEQMNAEEQVLTQSLCQRLAEAAANGNRATGRTTLASNASVQSLSQEAA